MSATNRNYNVMLYLMVLSGSLYNQRNDRLRAAGAPKKSAFSVHGYFRGKMRKVVRGWGGVGGCPESLGR